MSNDEGGREGVRENTVSTRVMEMVVAGLFMAFGGVVMWENNRVGAGWAFDGPQAGYFPFYMGLVMFVSAAVTFAIHLVSRAETANFVDRSQFTLVLKVLIPSVVYVVAIGYLGIYVAAAIFIAFFMWWLGKYPVHRIVPVALAVPFMLFMLFEVWFLVPLPKGPLEAAFGY